MRTKTKDSNQLKKGSVLVLFAVSFTLLMLSAAIVLDMGLIYSEKGRLQNMADASALASAPELLDEDILTGVQNKNQDDDVMLARDFAETYASYNVTDFSVDRNDVNASDGGVVVGHIENPGNLNDPLVTSGVDSYNSVQVTVERSSELNGFLQLLMGLFTGKNEVGVKARATATVEDRISGFQAPPGGTLPIVPFAVYEDSWKESFDGVSDFDHYNYDPNTGTVTNGSDGIPEFTLAPWFPKQGIPNADGNGRTLFITDNITAAEIEQQILNGMDKADLENPIIDDFILSDDGFGNLTKWVPGDAWMTSAHHSAMNSIQGQKRIIAMFKQISDSGPASVPYSEEEWYELTGFQSVVVCESFWPEKEKFRRMVLQPTQMNVEGAVTNPSAPHSNSVYAFSLTR